MKSKYVLTGKINTNALHIKNTLSEVVDIIMEDKTINEMISKRESLLRLSKSINDRNICATSFSLTQYNTLKQINVLYSRTESTSFNPNEHLNDVIEHIRCIHELDAKHLKSKFSDKIDFWWDISNDIIWSTNKIFMDSFLINNMMNSFNILSKKEPTHVTDDVELCGDPV